MSGLEGALCRGLHLAALMESTHPSDHMEARKLCGAGTSTECPALAACNGMATGLQRGPLDQRPMGTWAGRLYGTTAQPREHGTERGWGQHRHYREKTCEPCRLAHNAHHRNQTSTQVNPPNRTLERVRYEAQVTVPHRRANDGEAARSSTRPRGA